MVNSASNPSPGSRYVLVKLTNSGATSRLVYKLRLANKTRNLRTGGVDYKICCFFSHKVAKLNAVAQHAAHRSANPPHRSANPPQRSQYPPQQSAPPLNQSSVVIMQQPTASMKRTWTNELCGCFDDCNICKQ